MMGRLRGVVFFALCVLNTVGTDVLSGAEPARPTNLLLITADNLGYGDLACYRSVSTIRTPHLDQLAREGARLTSFYTASSTCTVSRACLLTGRIAQRHRLMDQLVSVEGNYDIGLNHREILIPQILNAAPTPYATGCFGKWNIGFAKGSRPLDRGFDEFLGHASGNLDYFHHNYRERHDLYCGNDPLYRDGEYSTDLFADAAIHFINASVRRRRPWFCYLPFNAPHFPVKGNKLNGESAIWQAPDSAFLEVGCSPRETDPRKRYEVVVHALDTAIGRVLEAVERAGCVRNTMVFFMSDNGAFTLGRKGIDVGNNDPLREGGVTCWEGGIRVPAIARWPGHISAGTVIDEPFWSPDLLVAAARLARAPLPPDIRLDGKDPLPLLTEGADSPHRSLFFSYRSHAALRMGPWKIVREKPTHDWRLFHLERDPGERQNLAAKLPEKVAELSAEFERWQASF